MVGVIEQLVWEPEANNRSSKARSVHHAEHRVTLHNPGDLPPDSRYESVSKDGLNRNPVAVMLGPAAGRRKTGQATLRKPGIWLSQKRWQVSAGRLSMPKASAVNLSPWAMA